MKATKKLIESSNAYFGLESKNDRKWFYGYGAFMLLITVINVATWIF